MINDCWLTTLDNPYDYFEQFTLWFLFDVEKGYNTCSLVDRILSKNNVSFENLSQKEINDETEKAIDDIIKYDITDNYKKIWRNPVTTETTED